MIIYSEEASGSDYVIYLRKFFEVISQHNLKFALDKLHFKTKCYLYCFVFHLLPLYIEYLSM